MVLIEQNNIKFDRIMGLPYGGLLFSYGVINILSVPCLAIRKEGKKNYSTKGEILGLRNENEKILLIEDATVTANTAIDFAFFVYLERIVGMIPGKIGYRGKCKKNFEQNNILNFYFHGNEGCFLYK